MFNVGDSWSENIQIHFGVYTEMPDNTSFSSENFEYIDLVFCVAINVSRVY